MEKNEFISSCKKVRSSRNHQATGSFGIKAFYKHFRKLKPDDPKYDISLSDYSKIIASINKNIAIALATGSSIHLMCGMGTLEVRKFEVVPKIDKNGKLKINSPVD